MQGHSTEFDGLNNWLIMACHTPVNDRTLAYLEGIGSRVYDSEYKTIGIETTKLLVTYLCTID